MLAHSHTNTHENRLTTVHTEPSLHPREASFASSGGKTNYDEATLLVARRAGLSLEDARSEWGHRLRSKFRHLRRGSTQRGLGHVQRIFSCDSNVIILRSSQTSHSNAVRLVTFARCRSLTRSALHMDSGGGYLS